MNRYIFKQIDKSFILENYNKSYHKDAIYFNIMKDNRSLGFYGLINFTDRTCEAFWIRDSFKEKVFTKDFFLSLFEHSFSLGYDQIYTWSECPRIIKLFKCFKRFGIDVCSHPFWDEDKTKTWFIRKI